MLCIIEDFQVSPTMFEECEFVNSDTIMLKVVVSEIHLYE